MRIRPGLLARFLLVLVPLFVVISAAGLAWLNRHDLNSHSADLGARIGNRAARVASALGRHDYRSTPDLSQDLLAPLSNDGAVLCVELRAAIDGKLLAALPPVIGCTGQQTREAVNLEVGDDASATLSVYFTDAEIEHGARVRRDLTLLIIGATFVIAVISAALGFRLIVSRPLDRLRNAIRRTAETGLRTQVAASANDELNDIIHAYNDMVVRADERETALACSHRELERSQAALRQLNVELELRVRERTMELEKAKARAESSDEATSRFLATMSHEIRTPLNGVLGLNDLLLDTPLDDRQRQYVCMAQQSGQSLLSIVNDILDFSTMEAGKLTVELIDVDSHESVRQVTAHWQLQVGERPVRVTCTVDLDVPASLRTDPRRLRRVLDNLLSNAIKFTESGEVSLLVALEAKVEARAEAASKTEAEIGPEIGLEIPTEMGVETRAEIKVEMQAEAETRMLRFELTDTGVGMPATQLQRLFTPFSQADASPTRKYGGTGLGLAICRQLVHVLGGQIGAESTPGSGTRFWFTLPATPADSAIPSSTVQRTRARGGFNRQRVLLTEDNPVNQLVAASMLRALGLTVKTATNGEEAVTAVLREPHDLILMDCQMPVMDGFTATARIREIEAAQGCRRHPIIALTANAMAGDRERCLAQGIDDFLAKPFTRAQMQEVLHRWLATINAEGTTLD